MCVGLGLVDRIHAEQWNSRRLTSAVLLQMFGDAVLGEVNIKMIEVRDGKRKLTG